MTRECDPSRHFAHEQQPELTFDRVNSDEEYQRTSHHFGQQQFSGGVAVGNGGIQINVGGGQQHGRYGSYENYGVGSYNGQSNAYYNNYASGYGNDNYEYGSNGYSSNSYGGINTADYYDQQQSLNQQLNDNIYSQDDAANPAPYNGLGYRSSDDCYLIGQNQNLNQGDLYLGSSNNDYTYGQSYQSQPDLGYGNQSDSLNDSNYSNPTNSYYQQGIDGRNGNSDEDASYQNNWFDLRYTGSGRGRYNSDQSTQYVQNAPYAQYDHQYNQNFYRSQNSRYSNQYSGGNAYQTDGYQTDSYQTDSYQTDSYQTDGFQTDSYQNGYSNGDDWSRMRMTLQSMIGHSPSEFNRNVPNDLGCATVVSAAIRQATGLRIQDTSVDGLENSLRRNGYQAIPIQYAQPGDCIIAHRGGNRHGHAAIYVGDGKVVNNSSAEGRVVVAPLNKFASSDYESVVAYRRA
jgi:hypothetical protein